MIIAHGKVLHIEISQDSWHYEAQVEQNIKYRKKANLLLSVLVLGIRCKYLIGGLCQQ